MHKALTYSSVRFQTLIFSVAFSLSPQNSLACSAYAPVDAAILAANYDWTVGDGVIFVNARGWSKEAFLARPVKDSAPAKWQSRYASVTATQWGRDFPMQGMNEAGLAGVVLNAPAIYPDVGESKFVISEMQWLQYQLDSYATVNDVARHATDIGIQKINAGLHFFFCDATSECGLIEFEHGSAKVSTSGQGSLPLRAITNSSYQDSLAVWSRQNDSDQALPNGYESLHRFVRAGRFAEMGAVDSTSVFENLRDLAGPGWTNWHSMFSLGAVEWSINPIRSTQYVKVGRLEFSISCREQQTMRRIEGGKISGWIPYDRTFVAKIFAKAAAPIGGFSRELQARMVDYSGFDCR